MVEEIPEMFIRNDEGRIHQFSDLWKFEFLCHFGLFIPKPNFNEMCGCLFEDIMAEGPYKAKV